MSSGSTPHSVCMCAHILNVQVIHTANMYIHAQCTGATLPGDMRHAFLHVRALQLCLCT